MHIRFVYFLIIYVLLLKFHIHSLLKGKHFRFDEVKFIFSFVHCAFCFVFKKSLPKLRSVRFSFLCSSRNFIVLTLTFRYMIHFL